MKIGNEKLDGRPRRLVHGMEPARVCGLFLSLGILTACGGGSSESGPGGNSPPSQEGGATENPQAGALFPKGGFGGGQEKILFINNDKPKYLRQLDLKTGVVSDLFDALPEGLAFQAFIKEGPTKSADGRIAVLAMPKSFPAYAFGVVVDSTGKQLSRFKVNVDIPYSAGHISPDGTQFAVYSHYVQPDPDPYKYLRRIGLKFYSVADGTEKIVKIYSTDPSKGTPEALIAWTPDNVLLVLGNDKLERFDIRGNLIATQPVPRIASPTCGTVSPDGKTLWFNQMAGNPYGPAVWSMDLATLQIRRRVFDSLSDGVRCPAVSPDGKFVALIQGQAVSDGTYAVERSWLGAAPVQEGEVDTTGKAKYLKDAQGVMQRAGGYRPLMY